MGLDPGSPGSHPRLQEAPNRCATGAAPIFLVQPDSPFLKLYPQGKLRVTKPLMEAPIEMILEKKMNSREAVREKINLKKKIRDSWMAQSV